MQPLALEIDSITLNEYFAKVLIDEDTNLNLTKAFRKQETVTRARVELDATVR